MVHKFTASMSGSAEARHPDIETLSSAGISPHHCPIRRSSSDALPVRFCEVDTNYHMNAESVLPPLVEVNRLIVVSANHKPKLAAEVMQGRSASSFGMISHDRQRTWKKDWLNHSRELRRQAILQARKQLKCYGTREETIGILVY